MHGYTGGPICFNLGVYRGEWGIMAPSGHTAPPEMSAIGCCHLFDKVDTSTSAHAQTVQYGGSGCKAHCLHSRRSNIPSTPDLTVGTRGKYVCCDTPPPKFECYCMFLW